MLATLLPGSLGLSGEAWALEAPDPEIVPVLDRLSPDAPGVVLDIEQTGSGPQFVLDNPTATETEVLSTAGDPLFRIGPGGVLANFRSPDWYRSKQPGGAAVVPERAADRGSPVWVRVSETPTWGWFDQRLRPGPGTAEQKADAEPLQHLGTWSVPLRHGDAVGAAEGHFEYRPPLGTFVPELDTTTPAPGVTLTALPGNPVPAVAVAYDGPGEVVVLGDAGEPFLRLTADGAQANTLSPTWRATRPAQLSGRPADAAAAPDWTDVGSTGRQSFAHPAAGPGQDLAALYALTDTAVVREWTVALVVDGRRIEVPGHTSLTPLGSAPISGLWTWLGAVVAVVAVGLVVAWWATRNRRRPVAVTPAAARREAAGTRS
ncbi:MAG: hypothetical protein AB7V44_32400 [Pseudonocardia sp.]